jgi:PHD/YefM family antitoxin component YafN of YafNO toxin-antitoxin module
MRGMLGRDAAEGGQKTAGEDVNQAQGVEHMRTLELKDARAVYDVELDVNLLDQEPVRLTSGGEVLGVLVSESEYEDFLQWRAMRDREAKRREQYEQFEQEAAAFQRLLPDLLPTYEGKAVAVRGGQVIEIGDSKAEVFQRVHDRLGDVVVYVQWVEEQPRLYKMPYRKVIR